MSRTSAARKETLASSPSSATSPEAANDTHVGDTLPEYVLSDAWRQRLRTEAVALDAALVRRLPGRAAERIAWMGRIQHAAWRDLDALAHVVFDGHPITRDELNTVGFRLEYLREVIALRGAPLTTLRDGTVDDPALRAKVRRCHTKLLRALRLRFVHDPDTLSLLRECGRWTSDAKLPLASDRILSFAQDSAVEAWLRALPRGEGSALDQLRALRPTWSLRLKGDAPVVDLVARVWTLCARSVTRIATVGRYLTADVADRRGVYAAYRAPRRTAPAVAQPVAPPVTPTP